MMIPTLKELTRILKSTEFKSTSKTSIYFRKVGAGLLLFLMDALSLTLTFVMAVLANYVFTSSIYDVSQVVPVGVAIFVFFGLTFYLRGLYPGFGIDVIEELRILIYSSSAVFGLLFVLSLIINAPLWEQSRLILFFSWIFSLANFPLGRSLTRKIFSSKKWWGIPVIIIGAGKTGEKVIKSLQKQSQIGLKPILAVDDDPDKWGYLNGIPVIGGLSVLPEISRKLNIDYAIIAMPNCPKNRLKEIIEEYSKLFDYTIVIPELFGVSSLWVSTKDLGGILGLEVHHNLLKPSAAIMKRVFDILVSVLLCVCALPLIILAIVLLFFDKDGGRKIFFRQERMGVNRSRFKIIKFRTMYPNSERLLYEILRNNPELQEEYAIYHKLRNDPRLTKLGRILRKFSIDELPQIINVFKGEMSLIGPRAYLPSEKAQMLGQDKIILKVKPGISGLWQVTDRNQSSFEERIYTDVYYIRNWSMFLDLYIAARTLAVVILGRGAY